MSTGKKKIELEELQEGYKLYVANCGGCHSLHVPSEKIKKEWDVILPKMFPKTHLTSDQQQLIKIYIYSKL